jgi:hypothetical protein
MGLLQTQQPLQLIDLLFDAVEGDTSGAIPLPNGEELIFPKSGHGVGSIKFNAESSNCRRANSNPKHSTGHLAITARALDECADT